MTLNQFLQKLHKTEGWGLDPTNGRYLIRNKNGECPISYLANQQLGTRRFEVDIVLPGQVLGLDPDLTDQIASASDDTPDNDLLRKRLLKACHLKEKD